MRIVYANNSPHSAVAMRGLLERYGHSVMTVMSGSELFTALRKETFDKEKFDVAISGNRLIDMSGVEVLQRIRQIEHLKQLPFILLSGDPQVSDRDVEDLGGIYLPNSADTRPLLAELKRIENLKR